MITPLDILDSLLYDGVSLADKIAMIDTLLVASTCDEADSPVAT
jgi:hypothetical protein